MRSGCDPETLLGLEDAAREVHVHPQRLRRLARQGKAPCLRIDGRYLFRRGELVSWRRAELVHAAGQVDRAAGELEATAARFQLGDLRGTVPMTTGHGLGDARKDS